MKNVIKKHGERAIRPFAARTIVVFITLAIGWLSTSAVAADPQFPVRPVRLIVPNVPGGGIDILARLLQLQLQKVWGQQTIVEYKPGAGTVLGTDYVAKSPPDGYTLGMVVTSHVINPSVRKNMPFDTLKDLSGVSLTAVSNILLSASPSFPAKNLADVIAYTKANPGKVSYASPGAGSSMHLAGELLKGMTGIDMQHIAYKGSGGAYGDVSTGRVQLLIDPLFASLPHVKSGRLNPIAVMSTKRDASAPDIPAAGETLAGFEVQSINGVVVPSATPRELVRKISADFATVLAMPETKKRLSEVGLEPVGSTPEQFDAFIRSEMEKWAKVVKSAGVTAE